MSAIPGHLEMIETGNQETGTEEIQGQEKTDLQVESMSLQDTTTGPLEMTAREMTEDLGMGGPHQGIMALRGITGQRNMTHTHLYMIKIIIQEMKDREIRTDQDHHRVMNRYDEAMILTDQVEIMAFHQTIKVLDPVLTYLSLLT